MSKFTEKTVSYEVDPDQIIDLGVYMNMIGGAYLHLLEDGSVKLIPPKDVYVSDAGDSISVTKDN